jgi:hypothetical protein
MKQIKIINGTYGFRPQPHVVERKNADDAPFFVEDAEADRLVALKVAVIVDGAAAPAADPVQMDPETDDQEALVYNEDMKLDELKDVARSVGATEDELKSLRSKKDVIALINEIVEGEGEADTEDEDPEDAPDVSAADPV